MNIAMSNVENKQLTLGSYYTEHVFASKTTRRRAQVCLKKSAAQDAYSFMLPSNTKVTMPTKVCPASGVFWLLHCFVTYIDEWRCVKKFAFFVRRCKRHVLKGHIAPTTYAVVFF